MSRLARDHGGTAPAWLPRAQPSAHLPGLFPGSAAVLPASREQTEKELGRMDSPDRARAVAGMLLVYSPLTRCNEPAQHQR